MHKDILVEMENCLVIEDLEKLFSDIQFPNQGSSGFFDKSIKLKNTNKNLVEYDVKLDGYLNILFRILLYLKLKGYLGVKPQNSGEYHYALKLHSILYIVANTYGINKVCDIDSKVIDRFISNQLNEKENNNRTIKMKINALLEYKIFDIKLPFFLRISDDIILNSREYDAIVTGSKKEVSELNLLRNSRRSYPLNDLKILISESILYLESYSVDCLKIAKHFIETKHLTSNKKFEKSVDFFKSIEWTFTEPSLLNMQINCKKINKIYTNDIEKGKARNTLVSTIRKTMRLSLEKFEVSCYSISLMLTGMRVGEFISLDRKLNISKDEYFNLRRIVYKTASSENGEFLEMPIPEICKIAIENLSTLAFIKDGKKNGSLVLSAVDAEVKDASSARIAHLLRRYCQRLNLENAISPHQFRHAMAFLIVHIHENDGLELARMFLGHTSINMTLQYMGHYNNEFKNAIEELIMNESEQMVDKIIEQIEGNKKLFGENAKRLNPNHRFVGQQSEEFIKIMKKGLLQLIEEQKLAVIQTPVSLCIHDLSRPEDLACQREFNIKDIVANGPAPSRCKGANCSNALFFEEHIEKLKYNMYFDIDPELKARLEKNTYFMEAGGFEQDSFSKIIKEYDNYKEGIA